MNFTVKIDDKALLKELKGLADRSARLQGAFQDIGERLKIGVVRAIDKETDPVTGDKWPERAPISMASRIGGGGKTLYDTGRLARSIAATSPKATNSSVSVSIDLPYAAAHNEGKTIRPKNSKFLAYPLSPEAKKAGSAKRFWSQVFSKGQRPFIWTSKRGYKFIAYMKGASLSKTNLKTRKTTKGKKGKFTLAWRLTTEVKLKQRRFMGFGRHHIPLVRDILGAYIMGKNPPPVPSLV